VKECFLFLQVEEATCCFFIT